MATRTFGKMIMILEYFIATLAVVMAQIPQGKYMCTYDVSTNTISFNGQFDNAGGHIDAVHAYDSAGVGGTPDRNLTPLDNCTATETQPDSNIYSLVVEVDTSTKSQRTSGVLDSSAQTGHCGISMINQTYQLLVRTFETKGIERENDRFFKLQCSEDIASRTWISAEIIPAGEINTDTLVRNRSSTLTVTDEEGNVISSAKLGQPIRLQYRLFFDSFEDGIDVLGAQITSLTVSYDSTFAATSSIRVIDNNGCSVTSSSWSTILTEGFFTSSATVAGRSPFIAQTQLFSAFRFTEMQNVYFQIKIKKFCTNSTDPVCFVNMCTRERKKRDTSTELDPEIMSTGLTVYMTRGAQEEGLIGEEFNNLRDCFRTTVFIFASIVTFILYAMMFTVSIYLVRKRKQVCHLDEKHSEK